MAISREKYQDINHTLKGLRTQILDSIDYCAENNFYYDNVSGGVLNNLTLPYRRNEYWDLSIYNQSINSDNNYFTYSCKFRITDQNKNKIYLGSNDTIRENRFHKYNDY